MVIIWILIIFCIVVGVLWFKSKIDGDKIKTEAVEFDTQKTMNQIAKALRSFNCQMERLDDDPLSNGSDSDIAVLMSGEPGFTDKFKHPGGATSVWGVQVYVVDLGNHRHVKLVALGQNIMGNRTYAKGYGLGFSRDYRDKIASMLA